MPNEYNSELENFLGMPSVKREGQSISSHCFKECQGIAMRDEIERLRAGLQKIADADMYDENGKPNGGGYFITLARAILGKNNTVYKD